MKIVILAIGKTQTPYLAQGIDIYLKRLQHYLDVELVQLPDLRDTRKLTTDMQKVKEGEVLLAQLQPSDHVTLLDERGEVMTSRRFAQSLDKRMASGALKRMVFVIGGPYGFSQAVYDRANAKLSLSAMTFSHEMVRLFFIEQIYRAMTILRGEPYHHD